MFRFATRILLMAAGAIALMNPTARTVVGHEAQHYLSMISSKPAATVTTPPATTLVTHHG